jgi:saccharopine dehydrogenase-like NADP-dependent oxidoreductase
VSEVKILVLGCGITGSVVIRDLVQSSKAVVTIGERDLGKAKQLAEDIGSERISVKQVDVRDSDALVKVMKDVDAVVNATWYKYNVGVTKAAIKAGIGYVDLGGLYHVTLKQLELNDLAMAARSTVILGCGCAPGVTNLLAKYGADKLDEVQSIHMYSGTVMFEKKRETRIAYSAQTLLDELIMDAVLYKDGNFVKVPPFSGEDTIRFSDPIGNVRSYYVIHSELATIPRFIKKGIKNSSFKIITSPETVSKLEVLKEFNFTSTRPINVKNSSVTPLEFLTAYLSSLPSTKVKREKEIHVVRVDVTGRKNGKETQYRLDLINEPSEEWRAYSSAFITGVPASITSQMLATGEIQVKGVLPPEACIEPKSFMAKLAKRNIKLYETVKEIIY